jgi:hypothetical protein
MRDNTGHLLNNAKWYRRKKPKLQIEILFLLTLRGKLSKGQAETILKKRHEDVIHSFDILEEKGLIKKSKNSLFGRGRRQYTYKITNDGLQILITDEETTSLSFWKMMYGYCNNSEKVISDNDIDKYFQLFFQNYLNYNNTNFMDLLDIFENMINEWINNFVTSKSYLSAEQKVLETLSLYPKLSFEELVAKSEINAYILEKVLYHHSMKFYPPILILNNKTLNIHENAIGKKNNPKYRDFIQHNFINITTDSKGEDIYELSLFGIILIFKVIRYFYNNREEKMLYYGNISFIQYFEKIVKNYETKLPLIFGKWHFLREHLKNYAIYNFDKIINKFFFEESTFSISRGGNNEFFSSIREIILQNRRQLGYFADAGTDCYLICYLGSKPSWPHIKKENYSSYYLQTHFPIIDKSNIKKTQYLISKYFAIINLLNPVEELIRNPELLYSNDNINLLRELENSFADEITAYYYFNLYFEYEFFYIMNTSSLDANYPQYLMPKECLHQILKLDKEIAIFYLRWHEDITNLQDKISNHLKKPINFIQFKD